MGKTRAEVTAPRVAELNAYTPVTVHPSTSLTSDLQQLDSYQVVVLTSTPLNQQREIADYCHKRGIFVVIADTFGLFGFVFTDFGEKFTVVDMTGEDPVSGIIAGIDADGLVTALDETRHGLEDGDYVTFSEIEGMEKLNDAPPRQITVKGTRWFTALTKPFSALTTEQVHTPSPLVMYRAWESTNAAVSSLRRRCRSRSTLSLFQLSFRNQI